MALPGLATGVRALGAEGSGKGMNFYFKDNPPKRGNAKKIWDALLFNGFTIYQLHYNSNGWGIWVFQESIVDIGHFCGVNQGHVYVQAMEAPYGVAWMKMPGHKYRTAAERERR